MSEIQLDNDVCSVLTKALTYNLYDYYNDFESFLGPDEAKAIFANIYISDSDEKDRIGQIFDHKNEDDSSGIWGK